MIKDDRDSDMVIYSFSSLVWRWSNYYWDCDIWFYFGEKKEISRDEK